MADAPARLVELRDLVDHALDDELGRLLRRVRDRHPATAPVVDALRDFVEGGKRVRPVLLLLGHEAAGNDDPRPVLGPALALELLHTFALAHDDVIDRAPSRRGQPTIHQRFATAHAEARWPGDSGAYGDAIAILVGDLAFVHADELFLRAEVPPDRLLDGLRLFGTLREEVMVGQYLDVHAAVSTDHADDRDLALTVATLKSGRYSVARPLELGALLGGASAALREGLVRFGDPLGRAFQVRDDLLGVFGEEATTGKSVSSDLAEGKRTLLIAEARSRLDASGRQRLEAALGNPELDPAEAEAVRDLLDACGAREATEAYVRTAVAEAEEVLTGLELPAATTSALADLAEYLGARRA